MITDTIHTYPVNDTSSFTIAGIAEQSSSSVNWANFNLSFNYFVDSDTLTDFGTIEFSSDNGATWIDLIGAPGYSDYLQWTVSGTTGRKLVLTGSGTEWINANVDMRQLGVFLDIQPGTTFLWRFGFISDAIQNHRDGLMYDNILVEIDPPIGIEERDLTDDKKLVKVMDLTGRETEIKTNAALIYLYNNGTAEKVFRID